MQPSSSLEPFAQTLSKTEQWMHEVEQELGYHDPETAYRATRATLHALRDQLVPNEAFDLAAQLPMLIRGLYFEGYKPSETPTRLRSLDAFLQRVAGELQRNADPPPQDVVSAIFAVLERHVSAGEIRDVRHMLPKDLQSLWPDRGVMHA